MERVPGYVDSDFYTDSAYDSNYESYSEYNVQDETPKIAEDEVNRMYTIQLHNNEDQHNQLLEYDEDYKTWGISKLSSFGL